MGDAFVRGSVGEIQLHQIPAARGRAFWPQHEQKLAADLYETEHPGVTVRRPWESEAEHAARKEKRKPIVLAEPELNMDPARAERELRRRQNEIAGLGTDHPEYDKQFAALVTLIHQLEHILGRTPTPYKKGTVPKKGDDVPPELVEKLAKYKTLRIEKRRESIEKGENVDLLKLIQSNETDPELRMMAERRIVALFEKKQEPVTA